MTQTAAHEHAPRPTGRPAMRFRWMHLLFIHWPVPLSMLRPLVPDALEIDTHDGQAWIGLVPFTMRDVRHTWWPPIPTMHHFHECNVRTYVRNGDRAGVWFFSLDAASRLAVFGARRFWNLNYVHSRISLDRDGDVVQYRVKRVREPNITMQCAWRAGAPCELSQNGQLANFLTERYSMYSMDRRGRLLRGDIWHEPWRLREAELLELDDDLVASAGVRVGEAQPIVYHVDGIQAEAWPIRRAR